MSTIRKSISKVLGTSKESSKSGNVDREDRTSTATLGTSQESSSSSSLLRRSNEEESNVKKNDAEEISLLLKNLSLAEKTSDEIMSRTKEITTLALKPEATVLTIDQLKNLFSFLKDLSKNEGERAAIVKKLNQAAEFLKQNPERKKLLSSIWDLTRDVEFGSKNLTITVSNDLLIGLTEFWQRSLLWDVQVFTWNVSSSIKALEYGRVKSDFNNCLALTKISNLEKKLEKVQEELNQSKRNFLIRAVVSFFENRAIRTPLIMHTFFGNKGTFRNARIIYGRLKGWKPIDESNDDVYEDVTMSHDDVAKFEAAMKKLFPDDFERNPEQCLSKLYFVSAYKTAGTTEAHPDFDLDMIKTAINEEFDAGRVSNEEDKERLREDKRLFDWLLESASVHPRSSHVRNVKRPKFTY